METSTFGEPATRSRQWMRHRDRALALLAARQHGLVLLDQLNALGFTRDERIERLDRTLWRVAPGVYSVGHPGLHRRALAAAALLYAGEGAGLSEESAARVWEIERRSLRGAVQVSVVGRRKLKPIDGVVFHRPRTLTVVDLVEHRGIRLTTPERTVIDLLPKRSEAEIGGMLEQMVTRLNRSPDAIHEWATGLPKMAGRSKLIRALDDVAGPVVVKSELEELFREVCREARISLPLANRWLAGLEVDAVWLRERVVVELDSWRYHGGRWQFHRDRDRGLVLARAGFEVIRLTWRQLKRDRAEVVATLAAVLQRRSRVGVHDDASAGGRW